MDQVRTAPLVGIGGCLAVLATLAYPYVAVGGSAGSYYGAGVANPLVAGLLAAVTIIVFAAGREERTDPTFAVGVALIFGLFVTVILVLWAATVRVDLVEITPLHRWGAVAVSVLVPAAGAWYARALGLV